jgi:hypothetical protein
LLTPILDSIYFDEVLFDAANVYDDIDYNDFLEFNAKTYKGPFDGKQLQLILKVICINNGYEYNENIIPTSIFEIAGIPVYIFKDQLPVSPNCGKQELRAGATFVPKLGMMIVEQSITQDIFYHEIIHAYQFMLESFGRFPKYYYDYNRNPFKRLWADFKSLFTNQDGRTRVRINDIFFVVRKEVHAYQTANHGTLTNCSIELCIIRMTSKNYGLLVEELEERNVKWLVNIVYIMVLCNQNILNPIQQQEVIHKILMTADFMEYLEWQTEFLLNANLGDIKLSV